MLVSAVASIGFKTRKKPPETLPPPIPYLCFLNTLYKLNLYHYCFFCTIITIIINQTYPYTFEAAGRMRKVDPLAWDTILLCRKPLKGSTLRILLAVWEQLLIPNPKPKPYTLNSKPKPSQTLHPKP